MMEETPGKVLSLLAVSLTSLMILFFVSYSNMSFSGSEIPVPDPFAPANVVAVIDQTAAGYSNFLTANLFSPAQSEYAFVSGNAGWVWDNSEPTLADWTGLHLPPPGATAGQVAGDFTSNISAGSGDSGGGGLSVDSLYSLLIK